MHYSAHRPIMPPAAVLQSSPWQMHSQARCTAAGVAPERQKIMVKGGMLRDDQEWGKAGIKPGAKLMMMGTADAVPQAPTAQQASRRFPVWDLSCC